MYKNLWDATKAIIRREIIALNIYFRKEEKAQKLEVEKFK